MPYIQPNKKSLDDAIQNLPEYKAPSNLWASIEEGMDTNGDEFVLQSAIAELPTYSPPDSVWDGIAKALPTKQTTIVRRLNWLQVAAACLVGVIATSLLYNFDEHINNTLLLYY